MIKIRKENLFILNILLMKKNKKKIELSKKKEISFKAVYWGGMSLQIIMMPNLIEQSIGEWI